MILPLAATHARSVLGACSPLLSILASAIDAGAADIGGQPFASISPRCEAQSAQCNMSATGSRRHYRVPSPVNKPSMPYSKRMGRAAPQPWPEFERVVSHAKLTELAQEGSEASKGSKDGPLDLGIKLNRAVLRFPDDVAVSIQGESTLALSGKAGAMQVDLKELDPTGLCAYQLMQLPVEAGSSQTSGTRALLALISPHKERFQALCARVQSAVRGVSQGYLVGLNIKGVGYRVEPLDDPEVLARAPKDKLPGPGGNPAKPYFFEKHGVDKGTVIYPNPKPTSGLRLKVGYSRTALYALPPGVRAFIVKPTQFYLYGLDEAEVSRVAGEIRLIRKPNAYTGNGIQLADEVIKLKARAGAK